MTHNADSDAGVLRRAAGMMRRDTFNGQTDDAPFLDALADSIESFLGMHWQKASSSWSSHHRDFDHYEGDPTCTDACIEDYEICNGCGTRTCGEVRYWLPIALAYLGEQTCPTPPVKGGES